MSDTRDRIIDSAAPLFAERGFRRTSIDDVIDRAGLSGKSHFYHYFRSKDQLGLEVLSRQFQQFGDRGSSVLGERSVEPLDRLDRFIDLVLVPDGDAGPRVESPFGGLAWEMAETHEGIRDRLCAALQRWSSQLEALLAEARPQLTEGMDTARLSRFVIAAMEGALVLFRVNADGAALRALAGDLQRFVKTHRRPAGER